MWPIYACASRFWVRGQTKMAVPKKNKLKRETRDILAESVVKRREFTNTAPEYD